MHSEILHLHSHRLLYYVAYLIAQAYTLVMGTKVYCNLWLQVCWEVGTVLLLVSFPAYCQPHSQVIASLISRPLLASFPLHILQLAKNWMVGRPAIDLVASFPGFCVACTRAWERDQLATRYLVAILVHCIQLLIYQQLVAYSYNLHNYTYTKLGSERNYIHMQYTLLKISFSLGDMSIIHCTDVVTTFHNKLIHGSYSEYLHKLISCQVIHAPIPNAATKYIGFLGQQGACELDTTI